MDGPCSRPPPHDKIISVSKCLVPWWGSATVLEAARCRVFTVNASEALLFVNSVNLSLVHPRLLFSVIFLDPVLQLSPDKTILGTKPPGMLNAVTYRRDIWPSREAASKNFAKSPIFASRDKRVLERMVRYGLRDLPTALYPDESSENGNPDSRVTLTTTKLQQVWILIRPNYSSRDASGHIKIDRSTHADIDPFTAFIPPYHP